MWTDTGPKDSFLLPPVPAAEARSCVRECEGENFPGPPPLSPGMHSPPFPTASPLDARVVGEGAKLRDPSLAPEVGAGGKKLSRGGFLLLCHADPSRTETRLPKLLGCPSQLRMRWGWGNLSLTQQREGEKPLVGASPLPSCWTDPGWGSGARPGMLSISPPTGGGLRSGLA